MYYLFVYNKWLLLLTNPLNLTKVKTLGKISMATFAVLPASVHRLSLGDSDSHPCLGRVGRSQSLVTFPVLHPHRTNMLLPTPSINLPQHQLNLEPALHRHITIYISPKPREVNVIYWREKGGSERLNNLS